MESPTMLPGIKATYSRFDVTPGTGVAFQLDIEDAIGLGGQIATLQQEISKEDLCRAILMSGSAT